MSTYASGVGWTLKLGNCRERMQELPANSVDAVVTDPPYGLGEEPPLIEVLQAWASGQVYRPKGTGFMGQEWDAFVPGPEVWREAIRVLKPGGHLLSFFGTRTFDLGTLAIRLAGFEVRDCLTWLYGQGWPKSKSHLKPGYEPVVLARKPLYLEGLSLKANVERWGTGALNVDGCRVGDEGGTSKAGMPVGGPTINAFGNGINTAEFGKPVPGLGRWPANVILDEEAAALLDTQAGVRKSGSMRAGTYAGRKGDVYSSDSGRPLAQDIVGSEGGASRFFYCPKASSTERDAGTSEGNNHTTIKPVELMRWLVRLVTPPGGLVLDPFTGSGTTGIACLYEGLSFLGMDMEERYLKIAGERLGHWAGKLGTASCTGKTGTP